MATSPGGPIEICFSFDTTGSMSSSIKAVKNNVQNMIQRLQADIPGIRIAVFAHGNYCDKGRSYVTKHIDFSTDAVRLCQWIKNVGSTGGGDSDECYELVLHEVQSLSWTPGTQRVLVMIGDACPHEPEYPQNTLKLNWRDEIEKLALMGLKIYAVQCRSRKRKKTEDFYKALADKTAGRRLELDQFSNLFDFIMAICYREHGSEFLDIFEKEVRARDAQSGVHKDVDAMFGALRDTSTSSLPPITKHPSLPKVKPKSLPFKPPMRKVPLLIKSSSITPFKKKTSIHKSKKTIAKRINSVDLDQKKLKLPSEDRKKLKLPSEDQKKKKMNLQSEDQKKLKLPSEDQKKLKLPSEDQKKLKLPSEDQKKLKLPSEDQKKKKLKLQSDQKKLKLPSDDQKKLKLPSENQKKLKLPSEDQKKLKLPSEANGNNLRKEKRKKVAEMNFSLNRLLLTPWEATFISSKPDDEYSREGRQGGRKGYRKSLIFRSKMQPAVLYKFSICSEKDSTRFVMYNKLWRGFVNASCWESRLLGDKGVRSQIKHVVGRGCSVFVRRFIVKQRSKSYISYSLKRYDYAWRRVHSSRNTSKV